MRTKYVAGLLPASSLQAPQLGVVAFPEYLEHAEVAQLFCEGLGGVVSAGFFRVFEGEVETYGESVGLKLSSQPNDAFMFDPLFESAHYLVGELPSRSMSVTGAVVFPDFVDHAHVRQVFVDEVDVMVSGGKAQVVEGTPHPSGRADSLGLESSLNDTSTLARALGLHAQSR